MKAKDRIENVAIYARVSTEKQKKEDNIAPQLDVLPKYAKKHGYSIHKVYSDDGISGSSIAARPAFLELLEDCVKGLFQGILVIEHSRLTRSDNPEEVGKIQRIFMENNIRIISPPEGVIDLRRPPDELVAWIKTWISKEERKEIRRKMARGKLYKLKQGTWLGLPPFGYSLDETRKEFSFNETEKALVERIFEMSLVDGMSVRAISDTLYREGERWRKDKVITPQIIRYCFRNECYCGSLFANRYRSVDGRRDGERPRSEWIEFKLPRLISRKTHNQLLHRLKNLRKTGRPATPGRYLFQGLLKCGLCGARLRVHKTQWSCYYSCYNRSQRRERERSTPDKKRCTLPYIRADKFDKGLFRYLIQQLADPEALKKAIAKQNFSTGRVEQLEKKRQKFRNKDKKIEKEIKNLLSHIARQPRLPKQESYELIWQWETERRQSADDIQEIERQLTTAREGDEKMKEIERHIDEVGRHLWVKIFERMIELGPVYQRKVVESLFGSAEVEVKPSKYKKSSPFGSGVTAAWMPKLNLDLISAIAAKAKLGESLKSSFDHSFIERERGAKKVVAKARGKGDHIESKLNFERCDLPWSTSERGPLLRSPRRNLPPA